MRGGKLVVVAKTTYTVMYVSANEAPRRVWDRLKPPGGVEACTIKFNWLDFEGPDMYHRLPLGWSKEGVPWGSPCDQTIEELVEDEYEEEEVFHIPTPEQLMDSANDRAEETYREDRRFCVERIMSRLQNYDPAEPLSITLGSFRTPPQRLIDAVKSLFEGEGWFLRGSITDSGRIVFTLSHDEEMIQVG